MPAQTSTPGPSICFNTRFMGSVYSRHVLGYKNPTVGLMSLGEEDVKGTELTKEVFKMLKTKLAQLRRQHRRPSSLRRSGRGRGLRRFCRQRDSENLRIDLRSRFSNGSSMNLTRNADAQDRRLSGARMRFARFKDKTNYEEYGGSPLLGVNGICIIAHGASTPLAIKNALRVAAESIEQQVNPHIVEEIRRYHETTAPLEPARPLRRGAPFRSSAPAVTCRRNVLTNDDLSQDGRYRATSGSPPAPGSRNAAIAAKDEYTSDMAAKAALERDRAGESSPPRRSISFSSPPPRRTCSFRRRPVLFRRKIGANKAACLDISAACAGFLFANRDRAAIHHFAHLRHRARHRRGKTDVDHQLDRSQHLRAFRRRRRRGDPAPSRRRSHGVISTHIGSDGQFTDILVHARRRFALSDHARERRHESGTRST